MGGVASGLVSFFLFVRGRAASGLVPAASDDTWRLHFLRPISLPSSISNLRAMGAGGVPAFLTREADWTGLVSSGAERLDCAPSNSAYLCC